MEWLTPISTFKQNFHCKKEKTLQEQIIYDRKVDGFVFLYEQKGAETIQLSFTVR